VIDFNPRLYNQIGLDIGRGAPLPMLACLGALGDESNLQDMVLKAKSDKTARPWSSMTVSLSVRCFLPCP
jgi:hypothetical protein